MSRNTRPLEIPARVTPYAHMITCPSSLKVRHLNRRAASASAPRCLPSQKLGPEVVVQSSQGPHSSRNSPAPLRSNSCRGRLPPTVHPAPGFHRLLAPCPRRAQTAGDSRPIAGSSGCPRPAQSSGSPRWIARIELVPKLTVRVRFPSPAPPRKALPLLGIRELDFAAASRSGPFQNPVNDLLAIRGPQTPCQHPPSGLTTLDLHGLGDLVDPRVDRGDSLLERDV